ncbi:MAG: hypothetical protein QW578_06940 [Thermoplasmatales archaeon]
MVVEKKDVVTGYEMQETEALLSELEPKQTKQNRNRKVNLGKYTEWYERKPEILDAKTYFWIGMQVQGRYRIRKEQVYTEAVGEWLKKVFNDRVKIDLENRTVLLDGVKVFSIYISRNHFYKHQNLPYIKEQVRKLIKGD